ncbi:phosphopantetheine-binding protein [Paracoccus sp. Z330]|uniref:Phosphopantetheine-binding protein n=1 Tax=Paracoccus onchidii TaxID=3017813 RepID=A0ABT4ZAJ5_9RHOB|nr:phosphopantetheine-binding protein [Paracoccus onchidii]MDB6176383.1 phosphopantetheine-binding protein [Paracoccus onchidii]
MNDLSSRAIDRDWLAAQIVAIIEDEEEICPDENLMMYGLDSVGVMKLIATLEQRGVTLSFDELAAEPSVNAWWTLIEARMQP